MEAELRRRFDGLEEDRRRFLDDVAAMTPAQQCFRPDEDSWSALLVAHHLVIAEELSMEYLRSGQEPGRRRLKHFVLGKLVGLILRSGYKVKVPSSRLAPREELPLEEVRHRWDEVRGSLKEYLDGVPAGEIGRLVFRHPLAGPFNLHQTLGFLAGHVRHHQRQLARLRSSPGFPES